MQNAATSSHFTLEVCWFDGPLSIFPGDACLDALDCCIRAEFFNRSSLRNQAVLFKVARVLMQWYVNDAIENGKDTLRSFETLFIFEIFVPQRVC
jgi:hypothetical protein